MLRGAPVSAIVGLAAVNAIWGLSFPLVKIANELWNNAIVSSGGVAGSADLLGASFMTLVRFSLALALLAVAFRPLVARTTRSQWLAGFAVGMAFAPGIVLQFQALHLIPASRSGILTSLSVVFTPFLVALLDRRLPRLRLVVGVVVALYGVAILVEIVEWSGGRPALAADALSRIGTGDVLTTAAALLFTVQIVLIDRFGRRMPSERLTPGMFVATVLVAAVVWLWCGPQATPCSQLTLGYYLVVVFLAVFCSLVAFYGMNLFQPKVSAVQAAVIYTLEPVCATTASLFVPGLVGPLVGVAYANERPGLPFLIGGAMVLAANVVALWPEQIDSKSSTDSSNPGHGA